MNKQKTVTSIIEETDESAFPLLIPTDYETGTVALDCFAVGRETDTDN